MNPSPATPYQLAETSGDSRLARALLALKAGALGSPDLVALIRSEAVRRGYTGVATPLGGIWPEADDWRRASFRVEVSHGDENLALVTPEPWLPPWTDNGVAVDVAAATREIRQWSQSVPGDPLLELATGGPTTYRTGGQRDAVRAVFAAELGETVVAVLPTGSGKTLVATAPAALSRPNVTLIVVPTVSLALDLERRIRADYRIPDRIAYHGGLDNAERVAMRDRLRGQEQWIVVTSPEAATTSLSSTLEQLATEGRLRYFVVDEAHMVASWGGAFRPAFQALAGLRRRLRQVARLVRSDFTTVLLSGTLDDYGLQLLRQFFADGDLTLVTAQATRPEPAYWSVLVANDDQKRDVLVDALRHLPRPVLVYTSLVSSNKAVNAGDVEGWLRSSGFRRVRRVTGESRISERQSAIFDLRCEGRIEDDCDIVVGTSAFGLGVDIEGIRAVVHACIPESIDRFYQEVGRSGRDGKASVSLLVHSHADQEVASGLAAPGNIGPDKAWLRWDAMRRGSTSGDGLITVSLQAAHSGVTYADSDANKNWNLHTLTLMELSGMIRLHWTPPRDAPDLSSDEELADYFQSLFNQVQLQPLCGDLEDQLPFKHRLQRLRQKSRGASAANLARMSSILAGPPACENASFAAAYCLTQPNGDVVHVDVRCGGCPFCRGARKPPWGGSGPAMQPYVRRVAVEEPPSRLGDLLRESTTCSVTYTGRLDQQGNDMEAFLRRAVASGCQLVVAPPSGQGYIEALAKDAGRRWFAAETLQTWIRRETAPPLVSLVLLPTGLEERDLQIVLRHCGEAGHAILIHDRDQPAMIASKLLLRELGPTFDLPTALRRI